MTDCYRCWAEVDLEALRQNLAEIRAIAGRDRKILTVVKADAYGHGLRQIAAVLMASGADMFGVANLAEAKAIRSVGTGWPILMLGSCLPDEVELAVREGVMPTISSLEEARRFSAAATRKGCPVACHLKVDTGMGRLGASSEEIPGLIAAIRGLPNLTIQGVYTHYSSAEDDESFTAGQRQTFEDLVRSLASSHLRFEWRHASNSSGVLLEKDDLCNMVRVGLLVYGVLPTGQRPLALPRSGSFRPALSWKCRVSLVKAVAAGTPISYGHTFVTTQPTRLAIISVGYGDGFFRAASNRAHVLVRGEFCPVLGRVTMDQTVIDVSHMTGVEAGDEVVIIGEMDGRQITANDLAGWCDTIPWEVLTNITYRVPRIYRGSHAA